MSVPGYRCIGGPLDGKLIGQAEGTTRFEVIEGPPLDWSPDSKGSIRPCDVKAFVYLLDTDPFFGTVWKLRQ